MYVQPSTEYEAVLNDGTASLGTDLELATLDNVGGTTQAYSSGSISEIADGVYAAVRTSPGTVGQFSLVWKLASTGEIRGVDDLTVVETFEDDITVVGSGNLYVTRADLKKILGIESDRTYSDLAIDWACASASRGIDAYKKTRYFPTTEIRYYTSRDPRSSRLWIDDLNSLTTLTVDDDGDGTYETTWVEGTDFVLDPANAELEGKPKREIVLLEQSGQRFPRWERAVRVSGSFGWASAPAQVTQAAILLANRFLNRSQDAPLGIVMALANEAVAMARIGRIDPDAAFLLDQLPGGRSEVASIRLG